MRTEIEAEGGTVEKFIGDAVMAAFGVPVAHEDDPCAGAPGGAPHAGARRREPRLEPPRGTLQIRIGVHTGEVLAAVDPEPGEAMVTGDAVNVAARLQTAAEPGELLASERTVAAARGFVAEDRGSFELKGKQEGVRAFVVLEESGAIQDARPARVPRADGRPRQGARSCCRASTSEPPEAPAAPGDDLRRGRCREVPPQPRVPRVVVSRETPRCTLAGRCLPYGDGITYWPLAEILKTHASILDSDPTELAIEKVRKSGRDLLTLDVSSDPARATAALAYTIGLQDPDISFADLDPEDVRAEVHAAWRSFFTALGERGPVVVVVEDIHWADHALLDLLEELTDRVAGPVLFLCPSRPDLIATRPGWGGGRRNTSSVALDPLTAEESDELIRALLAVDDLPAIGARPDPRARRGQPVLPGGDRPPAGRRRPDRTRRRPLARDRGDRGGRDPRHGAGGPCSADRSPGGDGQADRRRRPPWSAGCSGRVPSPASPAPARRPRRRAAQASRIASSCCLARARRSRASPNTSSSTSSLATSRTSHSRGRSVHGRTPRSRPGWKTPPATVRSSSQRCSRTTTGRPRGSSATPGRRRPTRRFADRRSSGCSGRRKTPAAGSSSRKPSASQRKRSSFATDPLERVGALTTLAEAFFTDYLGDLAWRYFREAATCGPRSTRRTGELVAYLAARGVRRHDPLAGIDDDGARPRPRSVRCSTSGSRTCRPATARNGSACSGSAPGGPSRSPDGRRRCLEALDAAGLEAAEMALRLGYAQPRGGARQCGGGRGRARATTAGCTRSGSVGRGDRT